MSSFPSFPGQRRKHDKPTANADEIMKNTILTVLTTSKGWILRQILKYTGGVLASFASYATAKAVALDLPLDKVQAVIEPGTAFASAAVVLIFELVLSFLARKNP